MKGSRAKFFIMFLALMFIVFFSGNSDAKRQLTIGTASLGGAYYPIGTGIAEIVTKYVPEIQMTAEVTGGSTENPRLIGTGQQDVGICNANHGWGAYRGEPPYEKKYDIKAIGSLHSSVFHMVTIDGTGIKTVSDLKGKRVAVGPAGGGSVPILKAVFSVFEDLKFEDLRPTYTAYSDGITDLKDGNVKAVTFLAGFPAAAIMELAVTHKVRFIDIPEPKMAEILKKFPYYSRVTLPTSTYKTDKEPVILAVRNLLVVSGKLDDDTVYKITKAIYTHLDELATYHASTKYVNLKEAWDVAGIPPHPGAAKFWKEKGLIK